MMLGKWQDFGHVGKRMEDGFKPLDNRVLCFARKCGWR